MNWETLTAGARLAVSEKEQGVAGCDKWAVVGIGSGVLPGWAGLRVQPGKERKEFQVFVQSISNITETELNWEKYLGATEKSEILRGERLDYLEQLSCSSLGLDRKGF
jgi:hypothetical protein